MAAPPSEAQQEIHALLEKMDMHHVHKSFRSPSWRPNTRRNKNIKTVLTEAQRREAAAAASNSAAATPSGAMTPVPAAAGTTAGGGDDGGTASGLSTSGTTTPQQVTTSSGSASAAAQSLAPNLAQANRSLSKLVLEKSLAGRSSDGSGSLAPPGGGGPVAASGVGGAAGGSNAPSATYTNIESAPSLAHAKRYCDVTGLPAPYTDPKTRLRYHNREVFALIRTFTQGVAEQYLEARGAHTVLK